MKNVMVFAILVLSMCIVNHLQAQESPIKRHVLALYDSQEEKKPRTTVIHENAEVILNHIGLILDYHDVNKPLPDDAMMDKYRGIISWFQNDSMKDADAYLTWLHKQIHAGKYVVILGSIGAQINNDGTDIDQALLDEVYRLLGVSYASNETDNPLVISIASKDSDMVEFERSLEFETTNYVQLTPIRDDVRTYLQLERTDIPDSRSSVVFTSDSGGYVVSPYAFHMNDIDYQTHWRINPFRFFTEAFHIDRTPVPDMTTRLGSRLLFAHIDGDAFISLSRIDGTSICGQIVINEILKKYVIPSSVSIVTGELLTAASKPWISDKQYVEDLVRDMYNIPYIEPASHGYTHPLHWEKHITAIVIPPYSVKISQNHSDVLEETEYEILSMEMGYIEGTTADIIEKEIKGSLEYISELAGHKKAQIMFWTGNCMPGEDILEYCQLNGIKTINAGDPIFDNTYDSYTFLCPIKRPTAKGEQFYTAACNENIYTNLWQGPYYGFRSLLETFDRTESPIRIKPANIYYHFYSGERHASLEALHEIYSAVQEKEYYPVYVSEYIDIAHDWFEVKITEIEPGISYCVENYGDCRTIRIDHCTKNPDLLNSTNIIGFQHHQGSLYVHLAQADKAIITLTDKSPEQIYVRKSTGDINEFSSEENIISFLLSGYGVVIVELGGIEPDTLCTVSTPEYDFETKVNENGTARLIFPANPLVKQSIPVTVMCREKE